MNSITVDELREKCNELFKKRASYDEAKLIAKQRLEVYETLERELVELMQTLEMKNFTSPSGVVTLKKKEYYPVPKESSDKEAIRKYMEEKGVFETYWSIHSASYNSWVKQEVEIAKEEKRFLNLPGLQAPTISFDLAMKKI